MYAPLVMVSGNDTIDWADSLASSVTANAAGSSYLVKLKPWKWSDGKPITAQDVAFSANLILQDYFNAVQGFTQMSWVTISH
jgi:peptide/nickel transport system substrate-binding protein